MIDRLLRGAPAFVAIALSLATCVVVGGETTNPTASAAESDDGWVAALLDRSTALASVAAEAPRRRLQILVSEVVPGSPDGSTKASLRRHGYRLDEEYVYPASAIKLAAAIVLFEELRRWSSDGASRYGLGSAATVGGARVNLKATLVEMLVVSSNEAFNTLFDVVGHEALNANLWRAGLDSVRIHHRLSVALTTADNRRAPEVALSPLEGKRKLRLPERESTLEVPAHPFENTLVGLKHEVEDAVVDAPMDFAEKNYASIRDLQRMMVGLVRPDLLDVAGFALDDTDRATLVDIMTGDPADHGLEGDPNRFKPMLPGLLRLGPRARFRYVNKAGRAYGFHLDNAYVEDTETGRAFFVTVVLYVNDNEVLNDNRYQYAGVSYPFLADLGEALGRELLGLEPPTFE